MKVHAVQLDIVWEGRAANYQKVRELVGNASISAGDLIVLPEMFDVGFSMNIEAAAQPDNLPSDTFVAELAAETDCCVVAGVVSSGGENDLLANEVIAIAPDGTELARYRKQRPFTHGGEHTCYAPGVGHKVFDWQEMKISPFVCYDLRFPELYRPAAFEGAQLLITVANWPVKRSEHWVRLLQTRAIENQAYMLGVNRCGSDPEFTYDGRTALFDPLGKCLFECDAREQVASAQIDSAEVDSWRDHFPALRDARTYGGE